MVQGCPRMPEFHSGDAACRGTTNGYVTELRHMADALRGEVLFIDARKLGTLFDCIHHELTDEDIARIDFTYSTWYERDGKGEYTDSPGFCRSAPLEEVRQRGHELTPGRYVSAEPQEDDGEPFENKTARIAAHRSEQQAEAQCLDAVIEGNPARTRFGANREEAR